MVSSGGGGSWKKKRLSLLLLLFLLLFLKGADLSLIQRREDEEKDEQDVEPRGAQENAMVVRGSCNTAPPASRSSHCHPPKRQRQRRRRRDDDDSLFGNDKGDMRRRLVCSDCPTEPSRPTVFVCLGWSLSAQRLGWLFLPEGRNLSIGVCVCA